MRGPPAANRNRRAALARGEQSGWQGSDRSDLRRRYRCAIGGYFAWVFPKVPQPSHAPPSDSKSSFRRACSAITPS